MIPVYICVTIISGFVAAVIMESKTESASKVMAYFFLGVTIGIFGIILAIVAPNEKSPQVQFSQIQQPQRSCPFCKELILADAIKCKHCGERFDELFDHLPS